MRLSFVAPHLSIQAFPTIDVPPFTLITGVNGAGKTHLLGAIKAGKVASDIAPSPEDDVRFFDWNSLVPNDTGEFQIAAVYNERDQIVEWARKERLTIRQDLIEWANKYRLVGERMLNT